MNQRLTVPVMAGFVCAVAWASEPGQPAGRSDRTATAPCVAIR